MTRRIIIPEECREWPYCELVQQPIPNKELKEPTVLVRRHLTDIAGPNNERLISLPGLPLISLFTGAGGMDIGAEQAGFVTVLQHEWWDDACKTLIGNRPNFFAHAALIQGDIRQTPTTMILKEAGLRVGEPYLITGGPPCQGFSTANTKAARHIDDTRNDLVFDYLRVVREAQPHFFLFENVEGILRFQGGKYFKWFLEQAYACGYELVYGLVDCVEYGVPQHRVRFLCQATRRDIFYCDDILAGLPAPECFSKADLKQVRLAERQAIKTPLFDDDLRRIRRAPGIRYFPDRPVLFPPSPRGRKDELGGSRAKSFLDFYDRLEREEPDRLVTMH